MGKTTTYVGLDVHKDTIAVALAEMGIRGEVREYGKIANTPTAVKALATKLTSRHGELRFCYEAGPCGYGIQRQLSGLGHEVCRCRSLLDPAKAGRADQDRPARCGKTRHTASGRGADPGVDSRSGARGDARSCASASGSRAQYASGTPAIVQFPIAAWSSLSTVCLDESASTLVIRSEVRPSYSLYSAGRCHRSCRSSDGAAGPIGGAD